MTDDTTPEKPLLDLIILDCPDSLALAQFYGAVLGWPLEEVTTLSLHGRPLDLLRRHLVPQHRLLALTADGAAPATIGSLLVDAGYGASTAWVLEELDGPRERMVATTAAALAGRRFADRYLLAGAPTAIDAAAAGCAGRR